jgi:hypothetical protein
LFYIIFIRHPQKAKTFTAFFFELFVVDLMCFPNGFEIGHVGSVKEPESPVDENIMHREIGKSVQRDAKSYPEQKIKTGLHAKKESGDARRCKNQEKEVVMFKPAFGLFVVMVFVQYPQRAVHDIFMREPGHEFHKNKGGQHD